MDSEMFEAEKTTEEPDRVYNELLGVLDRLDEFENYPLGVGDDCPNSNKESDDAQTGQPAECENSQSGQQSDSSSNTESDNSQIGQLGSVGNPVCNESPNVQPHRSSSAEPEAIGYLHNISPIKKGRYFEFQLQERSKTVRGVCFSPQKRKLFTELDQKESPVKIKKYRVDSTAYSEDLLMGHDVVVDACHDVDFQNNTYHPPYEYIQCKVGVPWSDYNHQS